MLEDSIVLHLLNFFERNFVEGTEDSARCDLIDDFFNVEGPTEDHDGKPDEWAIEESAPRFERLRIRRNLFLRAFVTR